MKNKSKQLLLSLGCPEEIVIRLIQNDENIAYLEDEQGAKVAIEVISDRGIVFIAITNGILPAEMFTFKADHVESSVTACLIYTEIERRLQSGAHWKFVPFVEERVAIVSLYEEIVHVMA